MEYSLAVLLSVLLVSVAGGMIGAVAADYFLQRGRTMGKVQDSNHQGKHRSEVTGNKGQGEGKHVDQLRQPTGRDRSVIDAAPDSHLVPER